jgi:hypothetical protein
VGTTKFVNITTLLLFLCGHCWVWAQNPVARSKDAVTHVPVVECRSDGQLGPFKPASGQSKTTTVAIPAEAARSLAYYKAQIGVLAPRGWHCFGTYGSNGTTLYVSPNPINSADLLSTAWEGFAGPVVQISREYGDTSGRFGVAKTIARVFPARKAFVEKVIAEGIEPASSFTYGPYPTDTLTYQRENVVEFITPAQKDGLGTTSRLQKSNSPISGVAILFGEEPVLLRLWVRLPSENSNLTRSIIHETERGVSLFAKMATSRN